MKPYQDFKNNSRCLKDAMLGDQCEDNNHCTGENTQCRDVCRCIEGYFVHPNENRCVKGIFKVISELKFAI